MAKKTTEEEAGRNSVVASEELRQFIERAEQLDRESRDIAEQKKDLFAEAKGRGYDTKAMRKIIAERKRDAADVQEEEAILDLYRSALGMTTYEQMI